VRLKIEGEQASADEPESAVFSILTEYSDLAKHFN